MLETDLGLYLRLLTTPKPVFVLMIIYCRLVHQLEAKAIFLVLFFFSSGSQSFKDLVYPSVKRRHSSLHQVDLLGWQEAQIEVHVHRQQERNI